MIFSVILKVLIMNLILFLRINYYVYSKKWIDIKDIEILVIDFVLDKILIMSYVILYCLYY